MKGCDLCKSKSESLALFLLVVYFQFIGGWFIGKELLTVFKP